jgi:hypothetical protein
VAQHVRPDQMRSLAAQARDVSGADSALDELIRIVNVTRVWRHWEKPVLVVVARDVPEYYAYLREVFGGVPWAHVVLDRRQRPREEGRRPWTIVHADPIEMETVPSLAPGSETFGMMRLLRWTWNTGWKIGESAAYQALPLGRG